MLHDIRGIALTTESPAAAVALDATVEALLGHRADLGAHLTACLIADPDLVAAQALAGFAALVQARQGAGKARPRCAWRRRGRRCCGGAERRASTAWSPPWHCGRSAATWKAPRSWTPPTTLLLAR
jgi:hypothetical protein